MPFTIRPYRRFPVPYSVTCNAGPCLKLLLAYSWGFWLLITLLVLSSGSVHAEWVAVEKNNELAGIMTVYVDPDTIRRKGNLVKMWQLIDFKTIQAGASASRFSTTQYKEYVDRAERRLRLLS